MKKLTNGMTSTGTFFLCLVLSAICIVSCKKDKATTTPDIFLKGTWVYPNGAEAYYDGVSTTAAGTKVPNNNVGFNFVVGEDYWENVQATSTASWTLNHIIRTSGGTKTYPAATFTKITDTTIQSVITSFGITEILTRKR